MLDPVRQGETAELLITLRDGNGVDLVNTYAGTETFDVDLWHGDDAEEVTLTTSAAVWDDADAGTVSLTLTAADTVNLAPPGYWLRLWLLDGSDRVVAFQDWLPIEPTAAQGEPLRVYGSFAAMVDEFPGVVNIIAQAPTLKADLSDLRHKAALWLDRQVMARLRRDLTRQAERSSSITTADPIEPTTGIDRGPLWGPSTIPDTTLRDQLATLQGHLDADLVMRDDTLEDIATAKALAYLFAQQGTPEYASQSGLYARRAARMLAGYTVAIDTDDDDAADLWAQP